MVTIRRFRDKIRRQILLRLSIWRASITRVRPPPHRFVAAGEIDVQNPVPNNAGFLSSSRVRQVEELIIGPRYADPPSTPPRLGGGAVSRGPDYLERIV